MLPASPHLLLPRCHCGALPLGTKFGVQALHLRLQVRLRRKPLPLQLQLLGSRTFVFLSKFTTKMIETLVFVPKFIPKAVVV
jgi:hypothetical protein